MTEQYNAGAIEVLNGLEPVRRRPGMYTDTARPNHLGQEVIDNSVDEALAGHASKVQVILHADQSLEVIDDGRGMPVDIHPEEKVSGVELILCKLHAGGKFSNKNYQFSGGLHGVGISVVNALSKRVEVTVRRDGQVYEIAFEHGEKVSDLTVTGTCGRRNKGTSVHFWPDTKYFDSANFSVTRLVNNLRAKAVLCPGLEITFSDKVNGKDYSWLYEDGLKDYLAEGVKGYTVLPEEPYTGEFSAETEAANWAVIWQPEGGELITESYVNLIPTAQGGTHVNGLRQGLLDAMREFCEFRNLLPRGVKLTGDDVFDRCSYVLSVKMQDPQFAGQTKERLSSRQTAAFVSGVVKDSFSLWLNEKPQLAEQLAEVCIANAHRRMRASKKVVRKKVASGPALPGKLTDCSVQDLNRTEIFFVEGDSAGGSAKQARDREFQAVMPLRGKILNTWEVSPDQVLASQEVHDISVALGIDPDTENLDGLRYGKVCILADADSDGLHIATLLCALFTRHFRSLVEAGHIYVAMPPLYRIDCGKEVFYALDDDEKEGILERLSKKKAKINVQRFKGLGEMNPLQLRETTMDPNTRRLVQLTIDDSEATMEMMDMLLGKKRADDRRTWLQQKGNKASELPTFPTPKLPQTYINTEPDVGKLANHIDITKGEIIVNPLDSKIKEQLEKILKLDSRIDDKLNDIFNGDVSPFFLSLMGLETTLIAKVSHSLSTTFGMSFYEQVCEILAKEVGYNVKLQHKILGTVSQEVNAYLQHTLDDKNYIPNRDVELKEIRRLAGNGQPIEHPDSTVDVFVELTDGTEVYIDITTVKPNKKEFRTMKRKLLTWTAMRLSVNPDAKVQAYIAIPYNPEKGNYSRHSGFYDRRDLLVADELWGLVSGGKYGIAEINNIFSMLHKDVTDKVSYKLKEALG